MSFSRLFTEANATLGHLPPTLRWMAMADGIFHPDDNSVTGSKSWTDVYASTAGDVVVGVVGGTYLEQGVPKDDRHFYHLNKRLAELFVRKPRPDRTTKGWSIVTGQGPGKAMAGPHYCLREARKSILVDERGQCESKCVGVPSGLQDENPHPFTDPEFTVRAQEDTLVRELLMIALAKDGLIVYPGWKGTLFETFLAIFINYCAGRSSQGLPAIPIILVDLPSIPERELELEGGSYFAPITDFAKSAARLGLTKPGIGNATQTVNVTWPNAAELIVNHIWHGLVSNGRMRADQGD